MLDTHPDYTEFSLLCQHADDDRRLMIYDHEEKFAYAQRNSVIFEALAYLSYEDWRDLRYLEACRLNETWATQA